MLGIVTWRLSAGGMCARRRAYMFIVVVKSIDVLGKQWNDELHLSAPVPFSCRRRCCCWCWWYTFGGDSLVCLLERKRLPIIDCRVLFCARRHNSTNSTFNSLGFADWNWFMFGSAWIIQINIEWIRFEEHWLHPCLSVCRQGKSEEENKKKIIQNYCVWRMCWRRQLWVVIARNPTMAKTNSRANWKLIQVFLRLLFNCSPEHENVFVTWKTLSGTYSVYTHVESGWKSLLNKWVVVVSGRKCTEWKRSIDDGRGRNGKNEDLFGWQNYFAHTRFSRPKNSIFDANEKLPAFVTLSDK